MGDYRSQEPRIYDARKACVIKVGDATIRRGWLSRIYAISGRREIIAPLCWQQRNTIGRTAQTMDGNVGRNDLYSGP